MQIAMDNVYKTVELILHVKSKMKDMNTLGASQQIETCTSIATQVRNMQNLVKLANETIEYTKLVQQVPAKCEELSKLRISVGLKNKKAIITVPIVAKSKEWSWDLNRSFNYVFSNQNRTAKGYSGGKEVVGTIGFTTGKHEWCISSDVIGTTNDGSQIYVGVCRLQSIASTDRNSWRKLFGCAAQGGCFSEGTKTENNDKWNMTPTKVKVELDCDACQVRVKGHVITLPPNETWYPIVTFGWYDANEQISVQFE